MRPYSTVLQPRTLHRSPLVSRGAQVQRRCSCPRPRTPAVVLGSQASDVSFSLDLDERQLGRLVQALDRDGDGLINYDEFLTALEMRDVMEL